MRPAGQPQACSTGAAGGAHRALRRVSWAMTNVELNVLDKRHVLFTSAQLDIVKFRIPMQRVRSQRSVASDCILKSLRS